MAARGEGLTIAGGTQLFPRILEKLVCPSGLLTETQWGHSAGLQRLAWGSPDSANLTCWPASSTTENLDRVWIQSLAPMPVKLPIIWASSVAKGIILSLLLLPFSEEIFRAAAVAQLRRVLWVPDLCKSHRLCLTALSLETWTRLQTLPLTPLVLGRAYNFLTTKSFFEVYARKYCLPNGICLAWILKSALVTCAVCTGDTCAISV